jgi:4-amino-4-deoxy-L-arabinose transferase-like glycosyltransferase
MRAVGILIALYVALHLPFLGQSFVIDDGAFLDQARHVLEHPADPYGFDIRLSLVRNFFDYHANPPGLGYYLALTMKLLGTSELPVHVACLPFSALALAAMFGLSRLFTGRGLLGATLLLVAPAFLVSSHTVMADVPATAFSLLAMYWCVRGVDEERATLLVGAGLAAGAASLLEYTGLTLLPLMALYVVTRRQLRPAVALPFALAIALFGAWCLASYAIYGRVHVFAAAAVQETAREPLDHLLQLVSVLLGAGGAIILPLALLPWSLAACFALSGRGGRVASILASVGFVAALPNWGHAALDYDLLNRILAGLLLAAGLSATSFVILCALDAARALRDTWSSPDADATDPARTLVLCAWVLGFLAVDASVLFATPKYIIPAVAPLILLLLGTSAPTRQLCAAMGRELRGAVVAATLALSLVLSVASAAQGRSHQRFIDEKLPTLAQRQRVSLLERDSSAPVWFNGHWTIRYYAERAGHNYLGMEVSSASRPRSGDIVFLVEDAAMHPIPDEVLRRLELVDTQEYASPLPLLLINARAQAGWWSHIVGIMPYVVSNEPVSTIHTFRVR